MTNEETIFAEALAKSSAQERAQYLDEACAGNSELRHQVDALLLAHQRGTGILESPPPIVTAPDEQIGSMIGPYKLLEQIGEGGMGVVYMAEQLRPVKRLVALKIIKPGLDTKQVIARFEAERQALAMMDHPCIAKVFDAGTTDHGRPYFVMELVRGIPLTDYCDREQLTPRQRLELFAQVCRAIQHAHTKGIIHRDIKPSNVLVTLTADAGSPACPKIIDFGIAKATAGQRLTDRTFYTQFRELIGTPLYMSPEQAELRELADVDTRSDVYSLGVLLYELLTGTTPFDKDRLAKAAYDEVRRIIREEDPPRPSTRLSTLGATLASISAQRQTDPRKLTQTIRGELDWIVMRAMEKDRARRYETAIGLAKDVERYLSDQPVEACPPTRMYRMRKFARRNKAALMTGTFIAAVLVLATIVSTWQAVRATRAEKQIARERDLAIVQKQRADEQAAIAAAVINFLNLNVLLQAGPSYQPSDTSPDPNLTVREALDRAADRVSEKFNDRPLVEAAVRFVIGGVYTDLGQFHDKAELHLKTALRLRREALGASHSQTLAIQDALGQMYTNAGQYNKAADVLEQVLKTRREALGDDHPDTLRTMSGIAFVYGKISRYEEAESLSLHVLEKSRTTSSEQDRSARSAMKTLAMVYANQGYYSKAASLQERALEQSRKHFGPRSLQTLQDMCSLASSYSSQGRYADAESMYVEALDGLRKAFGEHHRSTHFAMRNLALSYAKVGQYTNAEQLLSRVVDLQSQMLGARYPDPTALRTLTELAGVYLDLERFDEAEQILLRTLEEQRKLVPGPIRTPGPPRTMAELGHLNWKRGHLEEAEKYLTDALEFQRRINGVDDLETLVTAGMLGEFYLERGRHADAEPLLREVVDSWRKRTGERGPETLRHRQLLIHLYQAWGKPDAAARWHDKLPATRATTQSSTQPSN